MVAATYLDLENTIIGTFKDGGSLRNVQKIRQILQDRGVEEVGIFSFALFNEADKYYFQNTLQAAIEDALSVKVTTVPTIIEMMVSDYEYTGTYFDPRNGCDMSDWITIRHKEGAFKYWILNKFVNQKASPRCDIVKTLLIDDVVPNMYSTYTDEQLVIEYLNIDKYKE